MAPTYLAELQRSKMTAGNSFDVPKAPTYLIEPTHPTVPKQLEHEISSASMWLRTARASCTAGAQKTAGSLKILQKHMWQTCNKKGQDVPTCQRFPAEQAEIAALLVTWQQQVDWYRKHPRAEELPCVLTASKASTRQFDNVGLHLSLSKKPEWQKGS